MARPQSPARGQSRGPNLTPLIGLVGLAIVAIVVAALAAQNRERKEAAAQTQEPPPEVDPFADIVPGKSVTLGPGRRAAVDLAPSGLSTTPLWVEALAKAEQAFGLIEEAEAAEAAGDTATFARRAATARSLLNQALEDTALWEEEIDAKYSSEDRQVREIKRERTRWFGLVKKYRKVQSGEDG